MAVGQDAARAGVVVRHPRQLAAEHGLHGHVQTAVTGAQRPDPQASHHATRFQAARSRTSEAECPEARKRVAMSR